MNEGNQNYLAIAIIAASLILAASLLMGSSNIQRGLSGLQLAAPVGGPVAAAPQPSGGNAPDLAPPSPGGPDMKALLKEAAGKMGPDNAPVVLVEFSDFQCPFCGRWYSDSEASLVKDFVNTGKVLFVYKDYPLPFHPEAQPAALAARCAGEQGKFWEFHDKIFQNQATLSADSYEQWAKELKINETQFNSCVTSKKYLDVVQANSSEGAQYGVNGTPSFFVGKADGKGTLIVGAQPYSVFKQAIEGLLN